VNPDAKESRPQRGIETNFLDTEGSFVVTWDDRGQHTINLPEILRTGATVGVSSAYYPQLYHNWGRDRATMAYPCSVDGGVTVVRRF
jgi:hypothetical protein